MGTIPYKNQVFTISSLNGLGSTSIKSDQPNPAPLRPKRPLPKNNNRKITKKDGHRDFIPNKKLHHSRTSSYLSSERFQKNPGLAASLSALIWGVGQIYAESLVGGMYWFILQLGTVISLGLSWHNRATLVAWAQAFPSGEVVLVLGGILTCLLFSFLWIVNIRNAYQIASRQRRGVFEGVDNIFLLVLGSLFLPGLGQLLNGQTRKGTFYLIFSMLLHFFLFASIWIAIFWPYLVEPSSLTAVEWLFVMLPFGVGISLIALVCSLYDAIKVHLYPGIRESFLKRVRNNIQRRKMGITVPGELSVFRLFTRQIAFLFVLMVLVHGAWQFFPRGFYAKNIRLVSQYFAARNMKVLPTMLNQSAEKVLEIPKPFDMYAQLKSNE